MGAINGAVVLLVAVWFIAVTLDAILSSPTYADTEA